MTVGEALARAEELRPGIPVERETRQRWLKEADGMLRARYFDRSCTDRYDAVGADRQWNEGLRDEAILLVPEPFDALYPHYLCGRIDAALGENDRYAGEQMQYNSIVAELAAWLRRTYPPRPGTQWHW